MVTDTVIDADILTHVDECLDEFGITGTEISREILTQTWSTEIVTEKEVENPQIRLFIQRYKEREKERKRSKDRIGIEFSTANIVLLLGM